MRIKRTSDPRQSLIPKDKIFCIIERYTPWQVCFGAMIFYSATYFAVGVAISLIYPGGDYVPFYAPAELLIGFNAWVFFLPMVWYLYRWVPGVLVSIIEDLTRNQVIDPEYYGRNFRDDVINSFSKRLIYYIAAFGTAVTVIIYIGVMLPAEQVSMNMVSFPFYSEITTLMLYIEFGLSVYILWVMVFRFLSGMLVFSRFFKIPNRIVRIVPCHADGCGGFSPLGEFSKKILYAVLLGVLWILIYNIFPILAGGTAIGLQVIIIYIAYFVITPFLFLFPLLSPHRAMKKYKYIQLTQISNEIFVLQQKIMATRNLSSNLLAKYHLSRYEELSLLYDRFEKQIPTWPITTAEFRKSFFEGLSPIILAILPSLIEILKA